MKKFVENGSNNLMQKTPETSSGRLRLGIVGCGRVFERFHLPALLRSADWTLVAVCEPLRERREWLQETLEQSIIFDSFSRFLEEASLDAVLVSTPPSTHCNLVVASLEKGLHVLVEKPMALNSADATSMLEASLRAEKHLWICFNRRFRRPYLKLRERLRMLSEDSIGSVDFKLIFDSQGWRSVTPFLGDDSQGGGVLNDVASHQVDLVSWLLGRHVKEVKTEKLMKSRDKGDYVEYQLKFDGDLVAHCTAGHGPTYSELLEIRAEGHHLVAYASGMIETRWIPQGWMRSYCNLRTFADLAAHKLTRTPNVTLESFEKQLGFFSEAIKGEKPAVQGADARSGLRSVQVQEACLESIQTDGSWQALPY